MAFGVALLGELDGQVVVDCGHPGGGSSPGGKAGQLNAGLEKSIQAFPLKQ